ncbi:MAG: glycosyltransferase family 2 protein [Anaerolineales bacterium]|nr:glycosyltransferase family 2 protein [Anaerolineales bacterium]
MVKPLVSVVIPTRNRANYILQAVDSVFAQTFTDYEIVVVDDGSTDKTREILQPLVDQKRIRYVLQEPIGVSAARNHGVRVARAGFIAFLDSDDLFLPTKLEKQMALFSQNPELGFVHCWYSKFTDQGEDLGVRDTSRFQGWLYPQILKEWDVMIAMPCMLASKDVLLEVGGFDEDIPWAEDLALRRRIMRKYPVGLVPEVLVRVRVHPTSSSHQRSQSSAWFERYMDTALAEDPELPSTFKRQALAIMHTRLGQNLLGEGGPEEMQQVRVHSLKALRAWPLALGALVSWVVSFVPYKLRETLLTWLRKRRYPKEKSLSL